MQSYSFRTVVFLLRNFKNINLKLKGLSTVLKLESLRWLRGMKTSPKSYHGERPSWRKSSCSQLSRKTHFPKDFHQVACDFTFTQQENLTVLLLEMYLGFISIASWGGGNNCFAGSFPQQGGGAVAEGLGFFQELSVYNSPLLQSQYDASSKRHFKKTPGIFGINVKI